MIARLVSCANSWPHVAFEPPQRRTPTAHTQAHARAQGPRMCLQAHLHVHVHVHASARGASVSLSACPAPANPAGRNATAGAPLGSEADWPVEAQRHEGHWGWTAEQLLRGHPSHGPAAAPSTCSSLPQAPPPLPPPLPLPAPRQVARVPMLPRHERQPQRGSVATWLDALRPAPLRVVPLHWRCEQSPFKSIALGRRLPTRRSSTSEQTTSPSECCARAPGSHRSQPK